MGGYGLQLYRLGVRYTIDTPFSTTTVRFNDVRTSWPVGFSYAPIDNLEIGLGAHADNVPFWLTYRFLDGDFQMGARFAVYIPIDGTVGLQFGLPMQVRAGRVLRLDTGMFVTAFFPEGNDAIVSMHAPLRFGFQLSDVVFAGVQSGVYIPDFDGVEVPLMGFVGFTARTGPGPIDIGFRFGFDRFFWAGEALDQAPMRPDGPRGAGVDVNDFSFAIGFDIAVQY